jgi:hypothetical protein
MCLAEFCVPQRPVPASTDPQVHGEAFAVSGQMPSISQRLNDASSAGNVIRSMIRVET